MRGASEPEALRMFGAAYGVGGGASGTGAIPGGVAGPAGGWKYSGGGGGPFNG